MTPDDLTPDEAAARIEERSDPDEALSTVVIRDAAGNVVHVGEHVRPDPVFDLPDDTAEETVIATGENWHPDPEPE